MSETTSIGAAMANVVVKDANKVTATVENKGENKGKRNPFAALGQHTFLPGDGRQYPRQTGWGAQKKVHPDGGTNETIAWVVFKPFPGTAIELQGRVYCERFIQNGKNVRSYSISLPFLKVERKDGEGRAALEALKLKIREDYRTWVKTAEKTNSKPVATDTGTWVEEDSE